MRTKTIDTPQLLDTVKQFIAEGHSVTLRVKGQSMLPFLVGGRDAVVLHPFTSHEIKEGDIVLVYLSASERYILHRIIKREGRHFVMMGDGNCQGVEHFSFDEIIGRVTHVQRNGKTLSCESLTWKIYSKIWRQLWFSRRYLLAFYKRIILKNRINESKTRF